MDVKIFPGALKGTVRAIPSKSMAHRALICAALADADTYIECCGGSGDIDATIACLTALGAVIERDGRLGYMVRPVGAGSELGGKPAVLRRGEPGGKPAVMQSSEPGGMSVVLQCGEPRDKPAVLRCGEPGGKPAVLRCSEPSGKPAILRCGESGSTFRFLLPLAGALGICASFILEGRLPERPLSPLYEELINHGQTLSPFGSVPFNASGRLAPGLYTLDAGVSSQFVSGLLFALPLLGGDSELRLTGKIESFPYVELTMDMLETFGIQIQYNDGVFNILGNQAYRSPGTVRVEGDWSNAAFWLSAGVISAKPDNAGAYDASLLIADAFDAITLNADQRNAVAGGVACTGLNPASRQGDRAVVDILRQFGAHVNINGQAAVAANGVMRGIEIDSAQIPDLIPILAVIGAAAEGTTVIRNAGRLRSKESDRLAAITGMLRDLGADASETGDGLVIRGGAALAGGHTSSRGDHRIAMAAAITATICAKPVTIANAEAVSKSYPGFFDDFRALGGVVQTI